MHFPDFVCLTKRLSQSKSEEKRVQMEIKGLVGDARRVFVDIAASFGKSNFHIHVGIGVVKACYPPSKLIGANKKLVLHNMLYYKLTFAVKILLFTFLWLSC